MRMPSTVSVATLAALALPAVALGADDGHAGGPGAVMSFSWVQFVSAIVVFLLAFFILSRTAWPKILGALDARAEKIQGDIAEAEKSRKQAEKSLAEYEQALAEARVEAGKILDQARQDQQRLAAELKAKTEAELNSMRDSAKRDIEAAKKQAVGEIYDHMATVATSIAGRILEREISADDQRRLVEESLSQLQPAGAR